MISKPDQISSSSSSSSRWCWANFIQIHSPVYEAEKREKFYSSV